MLSLVFACTAAVKVFSLDALTSAAPAREFRAALERDAVVILDPSDAQKVALDQVTKFASSFFALTPEEQNRFGPLHEPENSEAHMGQSLPVGAWQSQYSFGREVNSFLDSRLRRVQAATAADSGLEVLPRGLDRCVPGCREVLIDAQAALLEIGLTALRVAMDGELPHDLSDLIDAPEELPVGACSAAVHRFAWYPASPVGASPLATTGLDTSSTSSSGSRSTSGVVDARTATAADVAFEAHTDGSWLTLVPCTPVPGLEVETSSGWLKPEVGAPPGSVAVLTGDGLQFLSGSRYRSALHRVVRPTNGAAPRASAPYLLRASPRFVQSPWLKQRRGVVEQVGRGAGA